jgi:hypothetical protein
MPAAEQPDHPLFYVMLNSIADWVTRYRSAAGCTGDFGSCSAEEVGWVAKDLGLSVKDLRELASKGPHAADLVQKMLIALKVDPQVIAKSDPPVMRDLQRLCINCTDKKRCTGELKDGTAAEHYHEFCPNALTLDALFDEHQPIASRVFAASRRD